MISDALLADLQNTVSSEGNHVGSNATPGYGSLNGARTTAYRSYDNRTSPLPPQSENVNVCKFFCNILSVISSLIEIKKNLYLNENAMV